jgi:hypothetical protein
MFNPGDANEIGTIGKSITSHTTKITAHLGSGGRERFIKQPIPSWAAVLPSSFYLKRSATIPNVLCDFSVPYQSDKSK